MYDDEEESEEPEDDDEIFAKYFRLDNKRLPSANKSFLYSTR